MFKLLYNCSHFTCYQGNVQNPSVQASAVQELRTTGCSRSSRGMRDQITKIHWILEKPRNSRKTFISASLTMRKPLTVWITTNCGKFFMRWENLTTLPDSWESCVKVKKQQLVLAMEQWSGSKLGKEYVKVLYCHPAYLTYLQSKSCEMPGWMKLKLGSRLPREMSTTSDMQMTYPLKSLLLKMKEESEKPVLKLNSQKIKIMASGPIISWQIEGDKMENSETLYFLGLQNHCGWYCSDEIKSVCSLEEKPWQA